MDSLETAALIAAMTSKLVRDKLDPLDFSLKLQPVAQALKRFKTDQDRLTIRRWLTEQGVDWDGESAIPDAILKSLGHQGALRRAREQLRKMEYALRYPNVAGREAAEEALRVLGQKGTPK